MRGLSVFSAQQEPLFDSCGTVHSQKADGGASPGCQGQDLTRALDFRNKVRVIVVEFGNRCISRFWTSVSIAVHVGSVN